MQQLGQQSAEKLRTRYETLRQQQPRLRARNLAFKLGVSEAELLACRRKEEVFRLRSDFEGILQECEKLGEVMALTRNEHCVHERHGVYTGARFFSHGSVRMGLLNNPDIDLRLFMNQWKFAFAVNEDERYSLQFFSADGTAVHKIYMTKKSDINAYFSLTQQFIDADATLPVISPAVVSSIPCPDEKIDVASLHQSWDALQDTHDFFPMLRRLKVGRMQAFRLAGKERAMRLDNSAMRQALGLAARGQLPIMIFVSSSGCMQIHTGVVQKLVDYGEWHNVLDPTFNLHLRESAIAYSWLVRKPSVDGMITSLELFDADEQLILMMFGARKPGQKEQVKWRTLTEKLPLC